MLATVALMLSFSTAPSLLAQTTAAGEVDVELVLAVDVSRSMDYEEVRIQREGYVAALRHPDFFNAVRNGLVGKIAISYYEWAGAVDETSVLDWQVIETAEDAQAFASRLEERPIGTQRRTSISAAIAEGATMLLTNEFRGMRQVIDISGDGPNNVGQPVAPARDKAVDAGIIINGLAMMLRPSGGGTPLDSYYEDCVIGGPGSFVLPVHEIEDFAIAVRRKLVLEVSGRTPASDIRKVAEERTDCMIGERQWRNYLDR
ncbi:MULTISPECIES: DUF1194 domain-containing protein [Pseudorhizobium]|uniref:DUF1194 domain-containing protein n=1 Tax=Pseudorhizobium pelagicum TaxID=1509405 RepID=A0A922P3Q4_9HYPH|nr:MULTISPECIES: DUF1194 domain-containing protein [Pseudorhizobium]KEQ08385.1 hypothetical protein GV67_14680 [Pseudorhizobium pelagicum]KEQ10654.1 hypothetical protein GV68_10380 [Pseudorhizobium pelagicum]